MNQLLVVVSATKLCKASLYCNPKQTAFIVCSISVVTYRVPWHIYVETCPFVFADTVIV